MAKRRTSRRKHHTRRGGIHGTSKSGLMHALELIIGGVAGGVAANMAVNTFGAGKDPKLVGAVVTGVGALAVGKLHSPLMQGAAIGFGTVGAQAVLKGMGVIKGIGETDTYEIPMNGLRNPQMLNPNPVIAGNDDSIVTGAEDDVLILPQ